ncbi:MAG TPA: metal-dependent transcriptional regulator [Candidatus Thermoplasmatota archaeon]
MLETVDGHLSENVEMYLKAILLLSGPTGDAAKTGDISKELGVTPAAVTEMLERLQRDGLVNYEKYRGARLSADGRTRARDVLRKHCIVERFLVETLDMREGAEYHDQACKLEHVISDELARRLNKLSKVRPECPDCYSLEQHHCKKLAI